MRRTSDPIRRATLVLLAICALLPTLIALVAIGVGAAAPTTQGLTQATGALSAAAFQGLDRRALDLTPLMVLRAIDGQRTGAIERSTEAPTAVLLTEHAPLSCLRLRV